MPGGPRHGDILKHSMPSMLRPWPVLAVLCGQLPLTAQPPPAVPPNPRPRVGLTLSGGSALGLAHAGVIEWLEEHAGTSMGGLVGAL